MDQIRKRGFIVGCSRSGTTVLQVAVASHSRVQSFPETFFFQQLPGPLGRIPLWLGLAGGNERAALKHALEEIGYTDLISSIPSGHWRLAPYVNWYVGVLDRVAAEEGKDLWVEKTPMHIFRLRLIQDYVPKNHVIHMVRDGRDVVASMCHRAKKYEGQFPGQENPLFGIQRWNRALRISAKYLGQPGHTFVAYEKFVRDPGAEMQRVCKDMNIDYEPEMATGSDQVAKNIIPDRRGWIKGAKNPPEVKNSKFERLFTGQQQKKITQALDLSIYERVRAASDL